MKKRMINQILTLILAGTAAMLSAEVKINHKQTTKQIPKGEMENNTYKVLNASPVTYTVNYNILTRNGEQTVGDRSANSTGIGLNYGWYMNGSLRIHVDGKSLTTPAKIENQGDTLTFKWENATLKMRFPERSDKIYCEITVPEAKRLRIGFLGNPGFQPKRKQELKPYVSTVKTNHPLAEGKYVIPGGESWFMLYDGVSNRFGIPVVLLDPAEVKSGTVSSHPKTSVIQANFEMNQTDCRFILMGFPNNHMEAESIYEDLKTNGGKYLKELKSFQF